MLVAEPSEIVAGRLIGEQRPLKGGENLQQGDHLGRPGQHVTALGPRRLSIRRARRIVIRSWLR